MIKNLLYIFLFALLFISCTDNTKNNTDNEDKKNSITKEYINILKKINNNDSLENQAKKFSKELKNKIPDTEKAYYYSNLGLIFYQHSLFKLAEFSFETAQDLYGLSGDSSSVTNMRMNQAAMKEISGNYEEAVSIYLEVIDFYNRRQDSLQLANAYSNLGVAYEEMEIAQKSIEYHKKALKLRLLIKDTLNTAYSYNNIGVVYTELLKEPDSALFYYQKSGEIFRIKNSLWQLATIYNNIGNIYLNKNDYINAAKKFDFVFNVYDSLSVEQGKAEVLRSFGQLHFAQRKDAKAIEALQKSLKINKKLGNQKEILEISKILTKIYIAGGNFSLATKTMEFYNHLNDSILNIEKQKNIADMEAKYQLKEKNNTIGVLSLEKKIQKERIRIQVISIILLSVISLLIVLIFYFNSSRNKFKQKQLRLELQNYLLRIDELQIEINNKGNRIKFPKEKIKEFDLSEREAEVLKNIALGYKNSEIAEKLCVSQNTIKSHIKNIYIKLDVKNRIEALKRVEIV